ncbi:MAG: hypothetical protein KIT58_17690 [Planctomycetota bacterium]|nr:hypothetical protein [Planctomycetota bacterium]
MSRASDFVDRVVKHVSSSAREYTFRHWSVPGKVTEEAVVLLPVPGVDPAKVLARVMDVGNYVGNVDHVLESRAIQDPRFTPPAEVRFYQRIKIPVLGELHHDLVMRRLPGTPGGFEVAAWEMLEPETNALSPKVGMRSQYSDGAWLVAPGLVGYALSSCPRRDDVGFIKWKAMTAGAEVAASKVIRENIECMCRWASRS